MDFLILFMLLLCSFGQVLICSHLDKRKKTIWSQKAWMRSVLFRLLIEFGFYLGAFILPFLYITIALVKNTLLAALWINTSIALLILW